MATQQERVTPDSLAERLGTTRAWCLSNIQRLRFAPAFRTGKTALYGIDVFFALQVLQELQALVDDPRSSLPFRLVAANLDTLVAASKDPSAETVISLSNGKFRLVVGLRAADLVPA